MEVEERVIEKIRHRRDAGREKYGTSMERRDLNTIEWFNHLQQELLDGAIYCEKLLRMLELLPEALKSEAWMANECERCNDGIAGYRISSNLKAPNFCHCRRGQARRLGAMAEERNEIGVLEDGFYRYFPEGEGGCLSEEDLIALAEYLRKKNKPHQDGIDQYFRDNSV